LLLHNNTRSHTGHIVKTLEKLDFEVLEHPSNPDLAPSDYHLFGPFKDALRDITYNRFAIDKVEVYESLRIRIKSNQIAKDLI